MALNSGPAPIEYSSPSFLAFTSLAADIDLKAQSKMPQRIPRMIAWNTGVLVVQREDGTNVTMPSWLAAQQVAGCPAKIIAAGTTATEAFVWW